VSNSCKEKKDRKTSPATRLEAPMPLNLNRGSGLVNELILGLFKAFKRLWLTAPVWNGALLLRQLLMDNSLC